VLALIQTNTNPAGLHENIHTHLQCGGDVGERLFELLQALVRLRTPQQHFDVPARRLTQRLIS
jgi:hypothetical protein